MTGDIVEKIRGFVVQLGWKKELDNLIAENESEYQVGGTLYDGDTEYNIGLAALQTLKIIYV